MRDNRRQDPLINMAYRKAFDQAEIHKEFADVMEQWGCAPNVLGAAIQQVQGSVIVNVAAHGASAQQIGTKNRVFIFPVPITPEQEFIAIQPEKEKSEEELPVRMTREQAYYKACLDKLKSARKWAISEPIVDLVGTGVVTLAAAAGLNRLMSSDDMKKKDDSRQAVGFGYLNAVFNMAFRCEDALRACFHLKNPPFQKLDRLEELFAKNMCFIPQRLWEKIIEEFMMARTNQMTQGSHLNNLEFALDLTIYKPKNQLRIARDMCLEDAIQEICNRIDGFFVASYEDSLLEDIEGIKTTVREFLYALAHNPSSYTPTKPLYLKGSHGRGKSFFVVDNLYKWIEELFPGSVHLERTAHLESANKLQGSADKEHGIMLDILRNQCKENKLGSLVFMDEATWLNNPGMVDPAKIVFNGAQSCISTKYFGDDEINIPFSPMLVIIASNKEITDEHLANRFKLVAFPEPSSKALIDYALQVAQQSTALKLGSITVSGQEVQDFIAPSAWGCLTQGKKCIDNFRDADRIVDHIAALRSRKPLIQEALSRPIVAAATSAATTKKQKEPIVEMLSHHNAMTDPQ